MGAQPFFLAMTLLPCHDRDFFSFPDFDWFYAQGWMPGLTMNHNVIFLSQPFEAYPIPGSFAAVKKHPDFPSRGSFPFSPSSFTRMHNLDAGVSSNNIFHR